MARNVTVKKTKTPDPLSAEDFLAIIEVGTAAWMRAKTASEFDQEVAVTILCLQENSADPRVAAWCIAAFMRGVLEGAGIKFPWHPEKADRRSRAKVAQSRSRKRKAAPKAS